MPALFTSIRLRFELAVGGYPCVADHSPAWSVSGDISVDAVDPAENVWLALNREGIEVARCTVERLLADLGLSEAIRGKARKTTIADPSATRPVDLVQRRFGPPAPNRLRVADLTYVSTWSGFAYVVFVTDAYARRILGWRVAATMATSMVLDSIEHAIWTREQAGVFDLKDVVHQTDRGSQYASIRFSE